MKIMHDLASRILMLGMGILIVGASGCAVLGPSEPRFVELRGVVTYRERIALAPEAMVIVQLTALASEGKPAEIVAEERLTRAGQVPVPFVLNIDSRLPHDGRQYTLSATILEDRREIFATPVALPVSLAARHDGIEILVTQVSPRTPA